MNALDEFRITVATPGVEVVTVRTQDGRFQTELHGGRLDGDSFLCARNPAEQHERACLLARMAAWPKRNKFARIGRRG